MIPFLYYWLNISTNFAGTMCVFVSTSLEGGDCKALLWTPACAAPARLICGHSPAFDQSWQCA